MKPPTSPQMPFGARHRPTPRVGATRKLVSRIELLKMRVAAAEGAWKKAKEHASQAKRRRKLAKLLAKRAKKDARSAKAHLDEVREALAQIEVRAPARAGAFPKTQRAKATRRNSTKRKTSPRRTARKTSGEPGTPATEPALSQTIPGNGEGTTSLPASPGEL